MPQSIRRSASRRSSRSKPRRSRRRYRSTNRECLQWNCEARHGPDAKGIVYCHRRTGGARKVVRVMDVPRPNDTVPQVEEGDNTERRLDQLQALLELAIFISVNENGENAGTHTTPRRPQPNIETIVQGIDDLSKLLSQGTPGTIQHAVETLIASSPLYDAYDHSAQDNDTTGRAAALAAIRNVARDHMRKLDFDDGR